MLSAERQTHEPALGQPDEPERQRAAHPGRDHLASAAPRASEQHDESGQHEELRQLGLRPHGDQGEHAEDRPKQGVRLFVERASLYAAITMMAITAAPIP